MPPKPKKTSRKDLDRDASGDYVVLDGALVALGEQIKSRYYTVLRDRYSIEQRPSARVEWVWYRAAEIATRQGLSADAFVYRQLAEMEGVGKFWPEAMASEKVAFKAAISADDRSIDRAAYYQAQLRLYSSLQPLYGRTVYRDPFWPFGPVVRCCLAVLAGDRATATLWRGPAQLEAAQFDSAKKLLDSVQVRLEDLLRDIP